VSGKELRALARRHGCRITRTRDGHYKFFSPDRTYLGKIKAGIPADTGFYRIDLAKRIQAYPVVERPSVPLAITPAAFVVAAVPSAAGVVAPPQPMTWQAWTAAEPRRGTRAARRRRWRSEMRSLPEAS
jgi:hypothetical protein